MSARFYVAKDFYAGLSDDPDFAVYDRLWGEIDEKPPLAVFGDRKHARWFAAEMNRRAPTPNAYGCIIDDDVCLAHSRPLVTRSRCEDGKRTTKKRKAKP